jgi:hypothetical protein
MRENGTHEEAPMNGADQRFRVRWAQQKDGAYDGERMLCTNDLTGAIDSAEKMSLRPETERPLWIKVEDTAEGGVIWEWGCPNAILAGLGLAMRSLSIASRALLSAGADVTHLGWMRPDQQEMTAAAVQVNAHEAADALQQALITAMSVEQMARHLGATYAHERAASDAR